MAQALPSYMVEVALSNGFGRSDLVCFEKYQYVDFYTHLKYLNLSKWSESIQEKNRNKSLEGYICTENKAK